MWQPNALGSGCPLVSHAPAFTRNSDSNTSAADADNLHDGPTRDVVGLILV